MTRWGIFPYTSLLISHPAPNTRPSESCACGLVVLDFCFVSFFLPIVHFLAFSLCLSHNIIEPSVCHISKKGSIWYNVASALGVSLPLPPVVLVCVGSLKLLLHIRCTVFHEREVNGLSLVIALPDISLRIGLRRLTNLSASLFVLFHSWDTQTAV